MQILLLADEEQKAEIFTKKVGADIEIIFAENFSDLLNFRSADACFILQENIEIKNFTAKPVFINSTIKTLKELKLSENFTRINGWAGFLKRETWEVATGNMDTTESILKKLNWKYLAVADKPGLISARIISMIINEAYFALGENISTKEEIDIAMKSGTSYPYGPFEWSEKIGLIKIYNLLKKLTENDSRYNIAPALEKEITGNF